MAQFQLPQGFAVGDAFQALNALAQDDNLADGIGQGYGVIGYKGKAWTLRYRGKIYQFVRPDDGTPASYIDGIILGSPANKSNSYYETYVPGQSDGEAPICASMNGEVPDVGVKQKQHATCALCPRHEWKTDPKTGRKSRECTEYKRLAFLLMPKTSAALLGSPLLEPVFLRVPPDSLQAVGQMGDNMAKQGYHYSSYVTRISFDQQKAHPSMIFTPVQGLSNAEAPVVLGLRQDPLVERIMHGDKAVISKVQTRLPAVGHEETGLLAAVANKDKAIMLPPPGPGLAVNTVGPDTAAERVDFSYANMATGTNVEQTVTPRPVTVADVGGVALSDADLDAKLAAMIKARKH